MHRALLLAAFAACGGSSPRPAPPPEAPLEPISNEPPQAPEQVANPSPDAPLDGLPPQPAPTPSPPAPPPVPIYDRLRDTDELGAGLSGFSFKRVADTHHCGGFKIVTTRKRGAIVGASDQPYADVLALEFPKGLSFSNPKSSAASKKKFDEFLFRMTRLGATANDFYAKQTIDATSETGKAAATARIAQVYTRMASILARVEIPRDVFTGDFVPDKIAAFCERLGVAADALQAKAAAAAAECGVTANYAVDHGWWNTVCVSSPTPPLPNPP